jgi:hypothetical protein
MTTTWSTRALRVAAPGHLYLLLLVVVVAVAAVAERTSVQN